MGTWKVTTTNKKDDSFLGGLGYLGAKTGLGAIQSIEGIADLLQGSGYDLLYNITGNKDYHRKAERVFANQWLDYTAPDQWYDAKGAWKIAGDVAQGIGTSIPSMAVALGITLATGGAGAGIGAAIVAGASAAGTGISEAYAKTGTLGAKEYQYGLLTGITEGGIEALTGGIGAGSTRVAKSLVKTFAKEATEATAEAAAKKGIGAVLKNIGINAVKDFAGEAIEEGVAEFANPYYARWTYDPNAKNATAEEIAYAAFTGGMAGIVMSGGQAAFSGSVKAVGAANTASTDIKNGTKIANDGNVEVLMAFAEEAAAVENSYDADGEVSKLYKSLKESLAKTNGKVETLAQKRKLGALQRASATAEIMPAMISAAAGIVNNAPALVERLNAFGYKDVNGNAMQFTVEDLLAGVDINDKTSIAKALRSNEKLAKLSAASVANNMVVNADRLTESALEGDSRITDDDVQNLFRNADPEKARVLADALGIRDVNNVTAAEVRERVATLERDGQLEGAKRKVSAIKEFKALPKRERALPKSLTMPNDGIRRYTSGKFDIAVRKEGDSYMVYDYTTDELSRDLTKAEVNRLFKEANRTTDTTTDTTTTTAEKGTVSLDSSVDTQKLSKLQKASLKGLERVVNALGLKVVVFESAVETRDGQTRHVGANGWYDPNTGEIHIDIAAGMDGDGTMLFTLSHELTHHIRTNSPAQYKILKDFLIEKYGKKGVKINELVAKQMEKARSNKRAISYAVAMEEVIADSCESFLADGDVITKIELRSKDRGLFDRIRTFISGAFSKVHKVYEALNPDSLEGKVVASMDESLQRMKDTWTDALTRSSGKGFFGENAERYTERSGDRKYSYSSISYSFFGQEKVDIADFEARKYKKTEGYKAYVAQCINNMRQTRKGFDETSARKEVEASIDGIVDVAVTMKKAGYDIFDSTEKRSTKDSKKRLLFSSLEPNSDYFTSSDISTICDKRMNFAEIYDEIVRRETEMGVPEGKRFFHNVDNYFVIHKILADKGLTQPCRQCYVESMRKNLAPMAEAFLRLMQETNPNNTSNDQLFHTSGKDKGKPKSNNAELREWLLEAIQTEEYDITVGDLNQEMLTTSNGLATLKIQAPLIYEAFNSFYGQSKPKMPKEATPFRFGELTALLTDNYGKIKKSLVKKIMSTGGFRLQSYSDFQIQNFADVLQVIFEAGTLGLNGHAYTKVPAFLDATKGTNLKRNISIFMYNDNGTWKIDKNDSFPYDLEKIYDIVKSDESGNTSIVAVSQNDDMSAFIMANDNIAYFIPFHKSGIKMGTVRETVVKEGGREIKGYKDIKDHTRQQTEVWAETHGENKKNTKVKNGISIYSEEVGWDFDNTEGLSQKKLIEKNVKAYIDACEAKGYLPRFRDYVMNNSSVLKNVLKYAKELGFASADATVDDISFEYKGYKIPYGYYKCLIDFGMFTPSGKASPIKPLSLADYKFSEAVDFFTDAETVRRNEILQQIANGEERERYRQSNMTTAQIAEEVQKKRAEVVESVLSGEYKSLKLSDRDSEGGILSAEQQKFFKDSKVRDPEGNLTPVYHGTPSGGFTEFKLPFYLKTLTSAQGAGFYFTDKANARQYMRGLNGKSVSKKQLYKVYLNITNPLEISEHSKGAISDEVFRKIMARGNYEWGMSHTDIDEILRYATLDSDRLAEMVRVFNGEEILTVMKEELGYDGVRFTDKYGDIWVAWDKSQIKNTTNKAPTSDPDIRYSDRDYAPTFYSNMGKVVDGIKSEKVGASGVVPYLKGKGVKEEEIKWSGIEAFLEGKKSVTKAELQEFVAGSQLQIEEQMSGEDIDLRYDGSARAYNLYDENGKVVDTFTYNSFLDGYVSESDEEIYSNEIELREALIDAYGKTASPRWADYRIDGGKNYRELVFTIPNSSYSNKAMRVHWGQDAEGVLAHARIQDFVVNGKKMLFIEEIQSDWHNEGAKNGYTDVPISFEEDVQMNLAISKKVIDYYNSKNLTIRQMLPYISGKETGFYIIGKEGTAWVKPKEELILSPNEIKYMNDKRAYDDLQKKPPAPDAPFRDTYHEYVLKRLLRMAAEEGYDSIGWTPAEIQDERWSDNQAHEEGKGKSGNLIGYTIEYDQDIPKFLRKYGKKWGATVGTSEVNGTEVWSMPITTAMKQSVIHEGQPLYSDRTQEYDSKDTSIKILPATFTKFGLKPTDRVLDWGGGQYDIAKKSVEYGYPGIKFEVVDAFNRTPTHNERVLKEYADNPATVLTINNVLNVIKETNIIEDVIRESKEYLDKDGVCYVKIHEGSAPDAKTGVGKVTSSGWQNNQPAEWYKQYVGKYYKYVERVGDILVASDKPVDKKNLPKVSKDTEDIMRGKAAEIAKSESSQRTSLHSDRDHNAVSNRPPYPTGRSSMTVGQIQSLIAQHTKRKTYTKADAYKVMEDILDVNTLDRKGMGEVADIIWQVLNRQPNPKYRDQEVERVAEYVVAKIMDEGRSRSQAYDDAQRVVEYLRGTLGRITFKPTDIAELEATFDKEGIKKLRSRWGYKKNRGNAISMSQFVVDVAREMPSMSYLEGMHPAEAFIEIDTAYERALSVEKTTPVGADIPDSAIPSLVASVKQAILNGYQYGDKSVLQKNLERTHEYTELLKAQNSNDIIKAKNLCFNTALKYRDLKMRKYVNMTQAQNDTFKRLIGLLGNLSFRGTISMKKIATAMEETYNWYTDDFVAREMFGKKASQKDDSLDLWSEEVAMTMDRLAKKHLLEGEAYNKDDYLDIYNVLSYFYTFVNNYRKVWRNGKWLDADPIANEFMEKAKIAKTVTQATSIKALNSLNYIYDPEAAIHLLDGYTDGFFSNVYEKIRAGAKNTAVALMRTMKAYDEFVTENPKYIQEATDARVEYRGVTVNRMQLIQLYMTYKRSHAWKGLVYSGAEIVDPDSKKEQVKKSIEALVTNGMELTDEQIEQKVTKEREAIEKLLTAEDKRYIGILENSYNVELRAMKVQRDYERTGMTNASDDYYVPIRRYGGGDHIDTSIKGEMDRIKDASFNKDIVKGAQQPLLIESADTVFNRHAKGVCLYANLSPVMDEYSVLYNLNTSSDPNHPVSIMTSADHAIGNRANNYIKNLFADVQGIVESKHEAANKILGAIRGGFATYQLGANPKVWLTQLSSAFASLSILDADSVIKGMRIDTKDVDTYSDIAELRNYDNTALQAMAVADVGKVKRVTGKIGEVLMKPIGMVDRLVVKWMWGACQEQTAKVKKLAVGTEENKREAAKLLEKVILQTQQNSLASEKSSAMRGNELVKGFTMFSADAMKVTGRVVDSIGTLRALKVMKKNNIAVTDEQLTTAKKNVRKAVTAAVLQSAYMAGVALLFTGLYNKDIEREEDEEGNAESKASALAKEFGKDFVSGMIGGLPMIRDVADYFMNGFDLDHYAISTVNDFAQAVKGVFDLISKDTTSQEVASAIKNLTFQAGLLLGIPVRNIYNTLYGLTKRVAEPFAYDIDGVFREQNYDSDLAAAVADGDEAMIHHILGLMYDDSGITGLPQSVHDELVSLAKNGHKVKPKSISATVRIDGKDYEMTEKELEDVEETYAKVKKQLTLMISSGAYKKLSEEQRAEAINDLHKICYDTALADALNVDKGENVAVARAIGAGKLAVYNINTKGIEADKDKNGKTVSGSKRKKLLAYVKGTSYTKEEKLLLFAMDYALKDGDFGMTKAAAESALLRYILSLKLTQIEKAEIAEACGFEVVNGKIKR